MQILVKACERELEALHERLGGQFSRSESRQRSLSYLKGLVGTVERKNGWQLAEWIGDSNPDGVQYLLERARWDADAARDVLRQYVVEQLGTGDGVLVVDETGFVKKVNTRRVCSASTAEPPDVSRTARSECFSAMRAMGVAPSSTASFICPNHELVIHRVAGLQAFPTR